MVGNSNLKPVTTVTSTLLLQGSLNCPYWRRDIFFTNAKPYGLNVYVI